MSSKRYHVFSHCTADRAASYRQVLSAFTRARECFVLHLRSLELAEQLEMSDQEVQSLLRQLLEWGNLTSLNDTTEVATVEEFYQPRYLYQLSADGEAAERALAVFEEALEQPGELQATALLDIRDLLRQLGREQDPARISLTLASLRERFEQLTARAQVFMGSLQRSLDLFSLSEEGLIGYKELLVDYLERFVSQLVTTSAEIARELEQIDVEPLLGVAARREAEDALDKQAAFERACQQWRQRWAGLRSWFLGGAQGPAQSEVLRNRARTAVTSLLAAITTVNDRRSNKSDRFSDYCALARWFAEADSAQAHPRAERGLDATDQTHPWHRIGRRESLRADGSPVCRSRRLLQERQSRGSPADFARRGLRGSGRQDAGPVHGHAGGLRSRLHHDQRARVGHLF